VFDTLTAEMNYVEQWAFNNNLSLNKSKTKEVVFSDSRRKQKTVTICWNLQQLKSSIDTLTKLFGIYIFQNFRNFQQNFGIPELQSLSAIHSEPLLNVNI